MNYRYSILATARSAPAARRLQQGRDARRGGSPPSASRRSTASRSASPSSICTSPTWPGSRGREVTEEQKAQLLDQFISMQLAAEAAEKAGVDEGPEGRATSWRWRA